jgi:hypothetical protein
MILKTSKEYNVSVEYLMAFMKNDSNYGTEWIAVDTKNPWNVWNTDGWSKNKFSTWQKWVDAVWKNLKRRIDEYKKTYWKSKTPTVMELANNIWPDGKWFLKWQKNYNKPNKKREWAYMTAENGAENVQKIHDDIVDAWISNITQIS